MGFVKRILFSIILLNSTAFAEPIFLYDFETGGGVSIMESSELAIGSWKGEVAESSFGLIFKGKLKFNPIANLTFDSGFNRSDFRWKDTSSLTITGGDEPFEKLTSWHLNSEYNKSFDNEYTAFAILETGIFYEDDMGGGSILLAAGLFNTFYLNRRIAIKFGGGLFILNTASEESYMPFEDKSGDDSYGLYPYLKVVLNENTTGAFEHGLSGYLEYGKGTILKANMSMAFNPLFSMDYFFESNRDEYKLADGNPTAGNGFVIKEDMTFGIRSNFNLQPNLKLTGEINYLIERKWEILDSNSDSAYTLKPDAALVTTINLIYTF
jgi:hypothetical protein